MKSLRCSFAGRLLVEACPLVLLLVLLPNAFAQRADDPAKTAESPAIRLETNLVNLNVKVTDIGGRPLVDLRREDFLIFENGEAQEVMFFEPVTAPINLLLLLDLSGSTDEKRKILMQAAKKFIDALGKEDRIAIAAFTRKFHLLSDFTTDRKELKKRIEKAKDIHGGTAFYDALWQVLDILRDTKDSRKAVVVLTDGEDNALFHRESSNYYETEHEFDELLDRAAEEDATIYPIYLNPATRNQGGGFFSRLRRLDINFGGSNHGNSEAASKRREVARRQLETLAESTAGTLFTADREEDLDGVYQRVAAELHQFYSLAYAPKNASKQGDFRKISLKVNRDGARAKTRRGYTIK